MTERTPLEAAARLGGITNLCHGFIYFAPEATAAYEALGLLPEQQYFASRAAALGAVPAEVATATFYNFAPELAHGALPAAWAIASPGTIAHARIAAAGETLANYCGGALTDAEVTEATDLAAKICDTISYAGTALAAGNRSLTLPDDPVARLWQLITIVREWRGDVHIAALVAESLHPIEALLLHAATGQVPVAALRATRGWSDEIWNDRHQRLAAQGLINEDGTFTSSGEHMRSEIEKRTNESCLELVEAVGVEGSERLFELLKPWQAGLLGSGIFPGTIAKKA